MPRKYNITGIKEQLDGALLLIVLATFGIGSLVLDHFDTVATVLASVR